MPTTITEALAERAAERALKSRVQRARRKANALGYRLWCPRGATATQYGTYALVDLHTNALGAYGIATIEDLERVLEIR